MKDNTLKEQIQNLRNLKIQIYELRKIYDLLENGNLKIYVKECIVILDKIYKEVAINSDKIRKIQRIIDYYIITLSKILNRYTTLKLNKISYKYKIEGSEELYTKIEVFIPKVNECFEKIYTSLFSDEILDIDAEIDVMLKELGIKK